MSPRGFKLKRKLFIKVGKTHRFIKGGKIHRFIKVGKMHRFIKEVTSEQGILLDVRAELSISEQALKDRAKQILRY